MTVATELTSAEATLALYEAARDAIVTGRVQRLGYQRNEAEMLPLSDLEKFIKEYRQRVAALKGGGGFQRVTTRRPAV
jgi:hypothetical protein